MSVKVTIGDKMYAGVDTIEVGGKSLVVAPEATVPSGAKIITENGTYDVSAFAQAVVNVSTGGAEEKTDYYELVGGLSSNSSKEVTLKHHGEVLTSASRSSVYDLFWANAKITVDDKLAKIEANGLKNIGSSGSFSLLSDNNFANLITVGSEALRESSIVEVNFPEVTALTGSAGGQFAKCAKLTTIVLPKLTAWVNPMAYSSVLLSSVQIGSVGYGVTSVPAGGDFVGATALTETIYATGEYVDMIVAVMRSANAAAKIVIKAAAATTYDGRSYAAGDTITTSIAEEV